MFLGTKNNIKLFNNNTKIYDMVKRSLQLSEVSFYKQNTAQSVIWVELGHPNSDVEILNPDTSECDLNYKKC